MTIKLETKIVPHLMNNKLMTVKFETFGSDKPLLSRCLIISQPLSYLAIFMMVTVPLPDNIEFSGVEGRTIKLPS